jgi:hypothetical protein
MKNLFLAAFAAIGLAAAIAPAAHAYTRGFPHTNYHSGSYDDTGHSPSEAGLNGGGG